MTSTKVAAYLRSHVLGLMAIFIALSGTAVAASDDPTASSSAVSNKKFKNLKKRVAAVESKLNGQATGDLQGVYPNLTLRNNSVSTGKIADNAVSEAKIAANAVSTTKIANDAVNDAKIAASAVGSSELKSITFRTTVAGSVIGNNDDGSASVTCSAGEDSLSTMGTWDGVVSPGFSLQALIPSGGGGTVNGANTTGSDKTLRATAACLAP